MTLVDRRAADPYAALPVVSPFAIRSNDITDGQQLQRAQLSALLGADGEDRSPHLAWRGFPSATRSFAVTVYDPDAPSISGFWHGAVCDIPAEVTELAAGAGDRSSVGWPRAALTLLNDAGLRRYVGAAPRVGDGPHGYFVTVHAVDAPRLYLPNTATPARLGMSLSTHTLARAVLVPTCRGRSGNPDPAEPTPAR